MKRISQLLTLLLAVAMLASVLVIPTSAKQLTVKANGFDSVRGAGELIIYTPAQGTYTETNQWGWEAIIEENVVVKLNHYNSAIPENGFVLSGHDDEDGGKKMGTWIKTNISVGDYVYYTADGLITVSDVPIEESVFYDVTHTVNNFNGTRYENNLIIYNKLGARTGTNEWGYEVTVTAGVVTSMGGNNSLVPKDKGSFVVSGHGEAVTWLQNNVKLGMSVSYDEAKKTVTFSYDENAVTKGMQMLVPDLNDQLAAARARYDYLDYSAVEKAIKDLDSYISAAVKAYKSDKDELKLAAARKEAEAMAIEAELLISESRTVQYRGVWRRPTETSAAQVKQTVKQLYDNGINMICIETLYSCTMIMPMPKDSLFETNPQFRHFDLLQAYIDACHELDMELHLWMPIYYVGDAGSSNIRYSLATKKPEWLSLSNTGKPSHEAGDASVGLMMLDPSNEEASNYLLNTYKYILETYDVDGFQLDYIRYYENGADYDMGYTKEALDAFEAKYGVRPKYDKNASYWNDWVQFRCNYINTFVSRVRKLIDETRPGVLLGADVVPNPKDSVSHNYQNYYNWLENGWIDILFPMAYGYGYEEDIIAQNERCGEKAFLSVGLGIFVTEFGPADMQAQASFDNSVNTDGATFFEASTYLKKLTGEHLLKGVYRNKAITPTSDIKKAAKAQIEYAIGRIESVIVAQGGVSSEAAAKVISALNELSESFTDKDFSVEKYNAAKTEIEGSKGKDAAISRMLSDLKMAVKGYTVLNKELDLSELPELPEEPDYSIDESTPDESTPDESTPDVSGEASGDETEVESENSEASTDTTETEGSDYTVIIIVSVVVVIAIAALAIVMLKKKGNK
ncbi:MAG: family 10 glycosylhydrolase [Clostridia bacterium]|nr:family 10 glycosylhydrolase [Clostridia bacterium]